MNKTMLAIATSLAILVTTSSGAKAAFVVTVVINGVTQTGVNAPNPTTAGAINGGAYNLAQTFGTIVIDLNSTATASPGVFARLSTTTFSVSNTTGAPATNVVVTISQDAFSFPGAATFNSPVRIPVAFSSGGDYTPTVTSAATGLGSYVNNVPLPSFGLNFANTGNTGIGGPSPFTITQTVTLNGIPGNSTFSTSINSVVTTVTPLPATGLIAAVAFPLFGLAGAFRRRVIG